MAEEMVNLIALYNEHKSILITLHEAGIIEEDEWRVINMFLENSVVLDNIKAIQELEKKETGESNEPSPPVVQAQSSGQGASNDEIFNRKEGPCKKDPRSATPREPTLDPEFISRRVNSSQWFEYPTLTKI